MQCKTPRREIIDSILRLWASHGGTRPRVLFPIIISFNKLVLHSSIILDYLCILICYYQHINQIKAYILAGTQGANLGELCYFINLGFPQA